MKIKEKAEKIFTGRLWVRIFLRVAAIISAFVLVLSVSCAVLLPHFFIRNERRLLISKGGEIKKTGISDQKKTVDMLSSMADDYDFEIELYNSNGDVLYTSYGSQMIDHYYGPGINMSMSHKFLEPESREKLNDGSIIERATDNYTRTEYLIYRTAIGGGVYAELRAQVEILSKSAGNAIRFIVAVSGGCLVLALAVTWLTARKISAPIVQMSRITKDMAELKFDKKATVSSRDEIGDLARSVNTMSEKLNSTLCDLKKSNAQLKDEIELERQLDVMRKGFVANVSHELKTPISIISGYAEGLKLDISPDKKDEYCNTIIEESERMNRLVLSLLDLSRYESGQMPQSREIFDISEVANGMLCSLSNGKNVCAEGLSEEALVFADRMATEQILKSYLENAFSHVNDGGRISLSAEEKEDEILVSVYNSGSHIDPEIMPQIWQSFYRGDTSHKRDSSRFGLGLSIVSAICLKEGKRCGVYNTEDGVCFWFTLCKAKL